MPAKGYRFSAKVFDDSLASSEKPTGHPQELGARRESSAKPPPDQSILAGALTAEWITGQVTETFPWNAAPRHLIRDRDAAFWPVYIQRVWAMGIRDRPIARRSARQNGHVERLIGSIRRECLDHLVISGEAHLRRIVYTYATYYKEIRTHLALNKQAPNCRR
jgi:Integrase core domain